MNGKMMKFAYGAVVWALCLAWPDGAAAQEQLGRVLRVRRISTSEEDTPEYNIRGTQRRHAKEKWFQVMVEYETAADWMDEVQFDYFILCRDRGATRGEEFKLFNGTITYMNIARGRHTSLAFLHPSTLKRYGKVERAAVVIRSEGRVIEIASDPSGQVRWWEQVSPTPAHVLNRLETPFAMLDFDAYEAIKPVR